MTPSAGHVFDALRAISESEQPPGVTELARQLAVPASTMFRALTTLEAAGYVGRLRNVPRFELGMMPALLNRALFRRFALLEASRPHLQRLAAETGETSSLSVRLGWYSLRLSGVYGNQDVYHREKLGELHLLHESLAGRGMLTAMRAADVTALRAFTARHHGDRVPSGGWAAFEAEEAGFVHERVEGAQGLSAVALPVRTASGEPIASIAVSGPVYRPGTSPGRSAWDAARRDLEQLVQSDPARFASPFAHIPIDDIRLRLPARVATA
jgi:DNA-binding IclR family transcriptional regulator